MCALQRLRNDFPATNSLRIGKDKASAAIRLDRGGAQRKADRRAALWTLTACPRACRVPDDSLPNLPKAKIGFEEARVITERLANALSVLTYAYRRETRGELTCAHRKLSRSRKRM